ncbi:DUF4240 domain-containing protein [Dactylosporangium vinaceum]|nr:DUF4240 domain-containing protein [Dactylosporangium vinaceum]
MDVDDFWTLIELSRAAGPSQRERETFLSERLGRISRRHLFDFVQHLSATREPANTYRLWQAADIIMTAPCGSEFFHYFQMWLVGLGRRAYGGDRRSRQPGRRTAGRSAGVASTAMEERRLPELGIAGIRGVRDRRVEARHRGRHPRRCHGGAPRPATHGPQSGRRQVGPAVHGRGGQAVSPLVGTVR